MVTWVTFAQFNEAADPKIIYGLYHYFASNYLWTDMEIEGFAKVFFTEQKNKQTSKQTHRLLENRGSHSSYCSKGKDIMLIFDKSELDTSAPFIDYLIDRSFHTFRLEWEDGEGYIAEFLTAFETDNEEEEGEEYTEYNAISFTIDEVIQNGSRRYEGTVTIDYRDFPSFIKDLTTNTVLFDSSAGISLK